MSKITIISSSNRQDNQTIVFSSLCRKLLEDQGVNAQLFSLQDLPLDLSGVGTYDYERGPLAGIVEKYLTGVDKLIFVVPEYNGSFPGILKLFIDAVRPANFNGKKAAIIGISSGRSGNIRGMDHLTGILNYVKVHVYGHKLPIAQIDGLIVEGDIKDEFTLNRISDQINGFLEF